MKNNSEKTLLLDGRSLKIQNIQNYIKNPSVKLVLDRQTLKLVKKTRQFLDHELSKDKKIIYGINTGFGPMADYTLSKSQTVELQYNLIRSHAVGMGNPLPPEYVLAAMLVRLNTLARPASAVSPELLETFLKFTDLRLAPRVPEHGAVGTSGDLVQLAHIALALIGEGEIWHDSKFEPTKTIFKKFKLSPYRLKPKEGLSLINGTSIMSGIAALLVAKANKLLQVAIENGAWSLEIVSAYKDGISESLHSLRPHPGQIKIARKLRNLLENSKLLRQRNGLKRNGGLGQIEQLPQAVQEIYSLRCIPQILGPILETIEETQKVVEIEINSSTDNPLVDLTNKAILHGGNFHGDYIAAKIDQMKASIIKLSMLSERRVNYFLNHNVNKTFPPFLNLKTFGLNLGLQGLQFVATSTAAVNQSLGFPHHLHSITTNGDNQDIVSMGTDAALLAAKVIENTEIILTIERAVLAQATDTKNLSPKLNRTIGKLYLSTREHLPKTLNDEANYQKLENLRNWLIK